MQYELKQLEWNEGDFSLFKEIVPASFHCCLQGKDPNDISDTSIIAIGAISQGRPIGIAIASCYLHTHQVKIHFIHVLPEFTDGQLGQHLLQKLQLAAQKEGGRLFTFIYKIEDPATPFLEKILAACNWQPAQPFMVECLYDSFIFNPSWIHSSYRLPDHIQEFPWVELTEEERQQILYDERRGVIPYAVQPFRKEHLIEPLNSLGLRHAGRVIGWIITHRTAPDKIVYYALYVERSFHFMGPGIKLLIDAMLIQKTVPIQWAEFSLPLIQVKPAWTQFIERRLIPHAQVVTHYVQGWFVAK